MNNKLLIIYIAIVVTAFILFGIFIASVLNSDLPTWAKIFLILR